MKWCRSFAKKIRRRSVRSCSTLPAPLHWFKWDAYWTWISGFLMLCLVYYLRADFYLIDNQVGIIVDAEGTRANRIEEIAVSQTMVDRVERRPDLLGPRALNPEERRLLEEFPEPGSNG